MPFSKIKIADQTISLFQDNVANAFSDNQNNPFINGQLISSVSLKAGQDNLIQHSLKTTPTIILPLAPNVSTNIWSPTTAALQGTNASATQVNLRTTVDCEVGLVVR